MKLVSLCHSIPVIFISAVLAFIPTQALSHCTAYHPHHCGDDIRDLGRRIDPTNPNSDVRELGRNIDRRRIDLMHLGGQGCRAKANDVMGRFRSSRGLTSFEKKYLSPWFRNDINLDRVKVFWGANLNSEMKIGGQTVWVASGAQTFGYRLFFRARHDPGDTQQLIDLAHELVHTVQHEKLGGLTRFCQKYMDGYVNGGMDYFGNPMEEEAFDLEFRFAQSLRTDKGKIVEIQHGMPNNHRTVWVPERLRVSSRTRNPSTARDTYYEFRINNETGNFVQYSINGNNYSLNDGYGRNHKFKRCFTSSSGNIRCNNKPRIAFDSSFAQGRQEKSYTVGDYPRETFRKSGNGLDLSH